MRPEGQLAIVPWGRGVSRLNLIMGAMELWVDDMMETGDKVQPVLKEDPSGSFVEAGEGAARKLQKSS